MTTVTVKTSSLLKVVKAAARVCNLKSPLESMRNIRVLIGGDRVEIAATDLDVTIIDEVEAKIDGEGCGFLAQPKHLAALLGEVKDEDLTLNVKGGDAPECTLITRTGRFTIAVMPTQGYPSLPTEDADIAVDGMSMAEAIQHVAFAASTDASRPNLNGVLIHSLDDGIMRCVATDGHRLALSERKVGAPVLDPFILPNAAVKTVEQVLTTTGVPVRIGFSREERIALSAGTTRVYVRLIDLRFPDYKTVIPDNPTIVVSVDRLNAIDALKRVALLMSDRTKAVVLNVGPDEMRLSTKNADLGSAEDAIGVKWIFGDENNKKASVSANIRYIRDVLSAVGVERVKFYIKDALTPVLIRPVEGGDDSFVIMPIRV